MEVSEAIRRFQSLGLEVEALLPSFRPNGFGVIDPLRPERDDSPWPPCTVITYFWLEGQEWVWESHQVVPGPGPCQSFPSLAELVEVVVRSYAASR